MVVTDAEGNAPEAFAILRIRSEPYATGKCYMTKSSAVMSEALRSSKPAFRKPDNLPKKAQKHRYERRKIREFLHLTDWVAEPAT